MYLANEPYLNKLIPSEQSTSAKLAESAAKIAVYNFEWRYITLVIFYSTVINGVEIFLSSYDKSQIIAKGLLYPSAAQITQQFVLFGSDLTEIKHMLDWLTLHQFDNTGKFIVICDSTIYQNCDEAEAAKIFWDNKIVNVIFLKRQSNNKEIIGYDYHPFVNDCHSMRPNRSHILNSCLNINNTKCSEIFPLKLTNLHKCPIIVSTIIQSPYMTIEDGKPKGADGDLLLLIADGINATLKIMTPHQGEGWTGSLADVYEDYANFSMTSAALTLHRYSVFQISIDYYSFKIVWVTHPPPMMPASLKLLYPFQLSTQIAVTISFIFVVICIMLQRYCSKRLKRKQRSIVFYSWVICMGQPIFKISKYSNKLGTVLFWIIYCCLIRIFYQVRLIGVLQYSYYYSDIESIEEAYDAHYRFGGLGSVRDYYMNYPLVYNKWEQVNTSDLLPTLYKISEGLKFVIAMNMGIALTLIEKYNIKVHILPYAIISSPAVLFFKKFSPLTNPINFVLRQLLECGFAKKTYTDNVYFKVKHDSRDAYEPINPKHYAGCYLILLVGWVSSIVCFIIELCWSKFHKI